VFYTLPFTAPIAIVCYFSIAAPHLT
jgi:hypothetical protein